MYAMSHAKARHARLVPVLATLLFFLPVTASSLAWAGDQGGGHDHIGNNGQNYTNYDAAPPPPATQPCESCLNGAMGSGYVPPVPADQAYTNYSAEPGSTAPTPCESCLNGASGSGYVPPVPLDQVRHP
jgi:hypothetical protein